MSKERELLERISQREMAFGPRDNTPLASEQFQAEAQEIIDSLNWLVAEDFIGGYEPHEESHTKGDIDRILITGGLTFKGQDKSQWPD